MSDYRPREVFSKTVLGNRKRGIPGAPFDADQLSLRAVKADPLVQNRRNEEAKNQNPLEKRILEVGNRSTKTKAYPLIVMS